MINKPPILFEQTQKIIEQIEYELNSTFLAYWTSTNGSVCQSDVAGLQEVLQKIGNTREIVLFLKSEGGSGQASLRIVHLLRHYTSHLKALVPLVCASAATMIALGADEIHMGPLAYLTAVDTSLTHNLSPVDTYNSLVSVSQDELTRVINLWRMEAKDNDSNPYQSIFQYVHPLVIGAVDRASSLSIKLCTEILSYHMTDRELAQKISTHLNSNYPSHAYPITFKEARTIGLNVVPLNPKIHSLLLELNKLYSEMGQRALTDFDEQNFHNNEILNILEGRGIQVYFQNDVDWHYRKEERRWDRMNDESSWRQIEIKDNKIYESVFHIR
ncbi:MAG: ATP-dependent Clp protease proteolytic subunit [Tolypothrix sp. T3-bin4]|nr:ATP-dependent Clp protease proteolytic subunit [Tolypothrix sp. T3-bin4]